MSVVIPVFDGERFIAEAIESVLAQDHDPIETIVVDDGSRDDSAKIAGRYDAVRVVRQKNQGPSVARNAGVSMASGALIGFLDADDLMEQDKISKQVAHLQAHPEVGCVLTGQRLEYVSGATPRPLVPGSGTAVAGDGVPPMSGLFRKRTLDQVGGFDPTYRVGEDMDLLFRLRSVGVPVAVLPEPLLRHRMHERNLSYRAGSIKDAFLRSLRERISERRRAGGGG